MCGSAVDDPTERPAYRVRDIEMTFACHVCGTPFVPRRSTQKTCGAKLCRNRYWYTKRRHDPDRIMAYRRRNAAWAKKHRNCKQSRPWLLGAPPYGTYLPGGGVELTIEPRPRWRIELRNTRALHGLGTSIVGAHRPRWPRFSLVPWNCQSDWGVYLWEDEVAARAASASFNGVLFDKPVLVKMSSLRRIRPPKIRKRGRQRLRLDAVTPVCITNTSRQRTHMYATGKSILNSLSAEFPRRLGVAYLSPEFLRMEEVYADSHPCKTPLGGKYGLVGGWTGHIIVECNAPAAWLLKCAGLVGLGSRTAFGFGRVRVSDVD